ncbi:MAG: enoyl-CoA hydratase/isomerase family protein [Anaerolineales bacterium]|jgi:enoyl-CoA hydratase/carnithine racemase
MGYRNWDVRIEDRILTLSLRRADQQNTLNAETMMELQKIGARIRDDDAVRVVILRGEGRHFSTGVDIQMLAERMDLPSDENRRFLAGLQRCLDDFELLGKPTIARLHGFCIGGGLLLALCCDFRIASTRTVFSLPEIKLGLPFLWGTRRITRVVGMPAAKEILYFGGRFGAEKARQYGLVHHVAAPDELDRAVADMARRLLGVPAKALELSKRIIHAADDLTLRESQDLELEVVAKLLAGPETKDAFKQYAEKRGVMD